MDATSATGSILDFSFPEVDRDRLIKDPSHYKNFLVRSINLFIAFMVKYVNDNRSNPELVQMVEAFFRRMEAIWGLYSRRFFNGGYDKYIPTWDDNLGNIVKSLYPADGINNTTAINVREFQVFSRNFYKLINDLIKGLDMHDLNQLISIVLLGGYEKIHYYINDSEHALFLYKINKDHDVTRIDSRDRVDIDSKRFSQMGRKQNETIANMPIIPLFIRLAAFIIKHPDQLSQLDDTAVNQAVDRAVSAATAKFEAAAAAAQAERQAKVDAAAAAAQAKVNTANQAFSVSGNAAQSVIGDKTFFTKGGRRTRHKRSGHKKRSGKRSNKRSDKRSAHNRSNKRMSRRR
jgi:hypothetical protein